MKFVRMLCCVSLLFLSLHTSASTRELTAIPAANVSASAPVLAPQAGYVRELVDGKVICRAAKPEEAALLRAGDVPLHVIYPEPGRISTSSGLSITLLATDQLEANPTAKAAFVRAAEIWESRIANPVSVSIKVDFGTTRFGEPYPSPTILGSASGVEYFANYSAVRGNLVARADTAAEAALYNTLPLDTVPTDLGAANRVLGTVIQLRTLGFSVPDDPHPNVGFNSAFSFDFDPSDGIDAGKTDFEAVTVHELGHVLGFGSAVGLLELDSSLENAPTIFDLFRFRPGVTSTTFQTDQRPMSSGGTHVHFNGGGALELSTGRPDGSGGDEQQASHWKDDALSGVYLGLMDPNLADGTRGTLTQNDLAAFDIMGFNVSSSSSGCNEAEPNETASSATAITPPSTCGGSVASTDASSYTITYTDGTTDKIEDVFKVTLSSSAKLDVSLTFTNSGADLDLFLFTVSGSSLTVLANASTLSTTERITTDSNFAAGTYYIGVSSFSGSSSYSLSVSTIGGATVPAAPSNLTATATSSSVIRLNWQDNSNNETEFRIEQKTSQGFVELGSAAADATSINVTGFSAGQTGTFRVRARNSAGDSPYSNEASATTPGSTAPCVANSKTTCLISGRFKVTVRYHNPISNQPGEFLGARLNPAAVSPDTSIWGFDDPQAVEVVVRIVDARPFAPRFDVYYSGLTDFEFWVNITDTRTGRTKEYHKPLGQVAGGVDRSTFPAE